MTPSEIAKHKVAYIKQKAIYDDPNTIKTLTVKEWNAMAEKYVILRDNFLIAQGKHWCRKNLRSAE